MSVRTAIVAFSLAFAAVATAQPSPSPLERANADAARKLFARITGETIADVPVARIIERVGGESILLGGCQRAEQIGGPREIAPGMIQIRLSMSGSRAAQLVQQAVAAKPERSPVPPDRLAFLLQGWSDRTFFSTGDNVEPAGPTRPATTVQAAVAAGPTNDPWPVAPKWADDLIAASADAPPSGSQLRTARVAEQQARKQLADQLKKLPLEKGTVGDRLAADADAAARFNTVIAAARIAGVDYRADGSAQVRLTVPGDRVWQSLVGR